MHALQDPTAKKMPKKKGEDEREVPGVGALDSVHAEGEYPIRLKWPPKQKTRLGFPYGPPTFSWFCKFCDGR